MSYCLHVFQFTLEATDLRGVYLYDGGGREPDLPAHPSLQADQQTGGAQRGRGQVIRPHAERISVQFFLNKPYYISLWRCESAHSDPVFYDQCNIKLSIVLNKNF